VGGVDNPIGIETRRTLRPARRIYRPKAQPDSIAAWRIGLEPGLLAPNSFEIEERPRLAKPIR